MRDWLVQIRKEQSLTQYEAADKAGISQSCYSNIEVGRRAPSVAMAKKIATALGFEWTRFYETEEEAS